MLWNIFYEYHNDIKWEEEGVKVRERLIDIMLDIPCLKLFNTCVSIIHKNLSFLFILIIYYGQVLRGMDIKIKRYILLYISTCERRREKEVMCVDLKFARINKKHNTRYNFLIYYSYGGAYVRTSLYFFYLSFLVHGIYISKTHTSFSFSSF